MSDFNKCPKGHIYSSQLKECPYCNGRTIEIDLENLPEKKDIDKDILKNIADCYLIGPKDI